MAELHSIKLVCCGDGAVGKTCLLTRYSRGTFPDQYVPTVFENQIVSVNIDNTPVQVEAVDTAGQEGYDGVRAISYPGTHIFVVCFSVDNADSLSNVEEKWMPELRREMNDEDFPTLVLVATKSDLIGTDMDQYDPAEANAVARRIGAVNGKVYECSAMGATGVTELFTDGIRSALSKGGKGAGCCLLQ
jgi:Ras family protein A